MTERRLMLPPAPGCGPRWRAAIVRPVGRSANLQAAGVIHDLRQDGAMAVDLGNLAGGHQIAGALSADAYDVVVALGRDDDAVRLALIFDVPVVLAPTAEVPQGLAARIDEADLEHWPALELRRADGRRLVARRGLHVRGPLVAHTGTDRYTTDELIATCPEGDDDGTGDPASVRITTADGAQVPVSDGGIRIASPHDLQVSVDGEPVRAWRGELQLVLRVLQIADLRAPAGAGRR